MSGLPKRQAVAPELTWDLTLLFATEAAYEQSLRSSLIQVDEFIAAYKGKLASATNSALLVTSLKSFEQLNISLEHLFSYANLAVSVDHEDEKAGRRYMELQNCFAAKAPELSFFQSELQQVEPALLQQAAVDAPEYAPFWQELVAYRPHVLAPEAERALAAFAPLFAFPQEAYGQTKLADMQFPDFEVEGSKLPLSFVLYENNYCHATNTAVRRQSFSEFSQVLRRYQHTIAADYYAQIQSEKTMANLRGFDSVFTYLLHTQRVSRELYDRQIDVIMRELAPHMRRYAKVLQRFFKLEALHYSDLKLAVDPTYSATVSITEARQLLVDALSVLGPEYTALIEDAFAKRRLDFVQNAGKATGGFCATPYRKGSFILLNWGGELSEVFTLAHELGHLGHFALAQANAPSLCCTPSWYLVEAPSTCNELLLTRHLLQQKAGDKRFKRWVIASMLANSYYHNFVTHLLEAAYQREVYKQIDQGAALRADDFSRIFREQLSSFWGDSVKLDEGAELTWMRQPHYYMGLYPYTYSAGLTIATCVYQRLEKEGEAALKAWLDTLATGGKLSPLEFAQSAGVDISTAAPLQETIAYIGSLVAELENLSIELEDEK